MVLALGELNETEQNGNQKPRPLPAALTELLKIFNVASKDGKTNGTADALRYAAWVGIQRHAESDSLSPEAQGNLEQAMLAIVQQRKPPEGRNQAAHDGLRRRAAATLGTLGDAGANGAVVKALDAVVADPTESIKNRAEMAAALKEIKAGSDAKIDFKAIANHIGWLLVDVGRPELAAAAEKEEPAACRRLRTCIKDGIDGLHFADDATDPNQKKFVDGVLAKARLIDKTIDQLDNPKKKPDNQTLARTVSDQIKDLEALLEPRVAGAPKPSAPPGKPPRKEAGPVAAKKPTTDAGSSPRPLLVDESVSVDPRATPKETSDKSSDRIDATQE